MKNERLLSAIRLHSVRRLSDEQLAAKLDRLNVQKHAVDAELVLYLSELERRRLYREGACSSLFEFCVTRLGQSEDVAYKRVGAARLMLEYPEIYELLANGRIHLTGLMLLKPHLTAANHQDWLSAASGKSKRQLEKLIATRHPQPDVPTRERKLPERRAQPDIANDPKGEARQCAASSPSLDGSPAITPHVASPETPTAQSSTAQSSTAQSGTAQSGTAQSGTAQSSTAQSGTAQSGTAQSGTAQSGTAQSGAPNGIAAARITPLSSRSYRVVFTASERLKQKLDRARELLSHAIAPSDLPAILERALDQLIVREERRRYGGHAKRTESNHSVSACAAATRATEQLAPQLGDLRQPAPPPRDLRQAVQPLHDPRHSASLENAGLPSEERERTHCAAEQCQRHERKSSKPETRDRKTQQCESPERERTQREALEPESQKRERHASCQKCAPRRSDLQDPDPNIGTTVKSRSRYVPPAVRREVWTRDDGQCTFVDRTGRRCEQRHFLELDHRDAFAIGGDGTADNLRLRCRAHNALEAEKLFGRSRVESAIAHAKHQRAK